MAEKTLPQRVVIYHDAKQNKIVVYDTCYTDEQCATVLRMTTTQIAPRPPAKVVNADAAKKALD